jgi:hypothetical protein
MGEMVGIRQEMWFVMLESAKDRILGVDTSGQQVSPSLLITNIIGCVSCSDEC